MQKQLQRRAQPPDRRGGSGHVTEADRFPKPRFFPALERQRPSNFFFFCWCVRGSGPSVGARRGASVPGFHYALHQSFWTPDISLAEQIVSYQNSISGMTCGISPPPSRPSPLPRRFHLLAASPDSCTHANSSTCASGRTRQVQAYPPPSHSFS